MPFELPRDYSAPHAVGVVQDESDEDEEEPDGSQRGHSRGKRMLMI